MVSIFVSIIISVIFLHFFIQTSIKYNILLDKNTTKPQAFHINPTPMIGGTFLIISIFLNTYYFTELYNLPLYFGLTSLFYFVGLIDDFEITNNPYLRLILIIISSFLIIFILDKEIDFVDIQILDLFLSNYIFSLIFTIACILFAVNGVNFLDGFNGLVVIHAIIIMISLLLINYSNYINPSQGEISKFIMIIIFCLIIFLIYNFPYGKIFLGDSGSYFTGIILSLLVIDIYRINLDFVSPVFYAILLHMIFFEVFFSYFRKIFSGKNPFYPDKYHLHMIIYNFLKNRNVGLLKSNFMTSIIYNAYYVLIIIPALYFKSNTVFCIYYFCFILLLYMFIYYFLKKKISMS